MTPRASAHSFGKKAWLAMLVVGLAGCAEPEGAPLGGPYGGNVEMLSPTDGGYDNVDATASPPDPSLGAGPAVEGAPGSWTRLFSVYLATGTVGNCTTCHDQMNTAPASYQWLQAMGYLTGPSPLLTNAGSSCLSWYGGNMPPGVKRANDDAVKDFDAWVQAGALNN